METESWEAEQEHKDEDEDQMSVRFITRLKDPAFRVPESAFFVPTKLARYGLSTIVNHLLDLDPPKPFDFLINNYFLRTSLKTYCEKHNVPKEETLTIEYVEALASPEHQSDMEHDDWVSSIAANDHGFILSGSYDRKVRLWDAEAKECLAFTEGHTGAITGVAWLGPSGQDKLSFVSSSKDYTLRSWTIDPTSRTSTLNSIFTGHAGAVDAVAVEPNFQRFCSGSWDHTIKLWDPVSDEGDEEQPRKEDDKAGKGAKKKQKVDKSDHVVRGSIATFKGHAQCVSCVDWSVPETIYSGSWDHSIRKWDADSGINTRVLAGEKVVFSVAFSPQLGLVASGHADRVVRLWDPRMPDGQVLKDKLLSHTAFVSVVAWHPTHSTLLASGSHDGDVKLWDIRSKTPLHTMPSNHQDKVLAIQWDGPSRIVSGGADKMLKVHAMPLPDQQEGEK